MWIPGQNWKRQLYGAQKNRPPKRYSAKSINQRTLEGKGVCILPIIIMVTSFILLLGEMFI